MDSEQQLRDLKAAIDRAKAQRARAEAAADQTAATLAQVRGDLESEFGVKTPEDAKAVMAQLESDLEAALSETREHLERTRS